VCWFQRWGGALSAAPEAQVLIVFHHKHDDEPTICKSQLQAFIWSVLAVTWMVETPPHMSFADDITFLRAIAPFPRASSTPEQAILKTVIPDILRLSHESLTIRKIAQGIESS
jgi:hypothetical protein